MRYSPEIELYLSTPEYGVDFVRADRELMARREQKRIDKEGSRSIKSDAHKRTSTAQMLGRSRETGLLIESGRFLEIWLSYAPYHRGNGTDGAKLPLPRTSESESSIARRINARARKQIRRIVNANDFRGMITLTIAPPSVANDKLYDTIPYNEQRDYEVVRGLFKAFVDRARRNALEFGYVAVFEMHDSTKTNPEKRGCWHVHLAVDVAGNGPVAARKLWRHGLTDYQDFRYDKNGNRRDVDVCNPGAYMAEYIGKEGAQFGRADLRNKRRYTCSRDCKRPRKVLLSDAGLTGDFDVIEYRGQYYKISYYDSSEIPNTNMISVNAHYVRVDAKREKGAEICSMI